MIKKTLLILAAGCLALGGISVQSCKQEEPEVPIVFAHRGCWLGTEVPENSLAAVAMAKRYGYTTIECDVHYTADSVMVLMHDFWNMQRCIRRKSDNSKVEHEIPLASVTFEELRRDYVLASDNPALREPVPTLEEMLTACLENGITPLLHSEVIESYHMAQRMCGNNWIAFTSNGEALRKAREISDCPILYDMGRPTAQEAVEGLRAMGGKCGISSMKYDMYTADFCGTIRQAGFDVQSSIFPTPYDVEAIRNGASILLSDFAYLPNPQKKPYKNVSITKGSLLKGNAIAREGEPTEYGACVLQITFKGSLKVTLNDERTYVLTRQEYGTDYVGMRFFRGTPRVSITAEEDSNIKQGKFSLYRF